MGTLQGGDGELITRALFSHALSSVWFEHGVVFYTGVLSILISKRQQRSEYRASGSLQHFLKSGIGCQILKIEA